MEGQLESITLLAHLLCTPLLALVADTHSRTSVLAISAMAKMAKLSLIAFCSLSTPTEHSQAGPAHSTLPFPVLLLTAVLGGIGFNSPLK